MRSRTSSGTGERIKNLKSVEYIYGKFLGLDVDRHSTTIVGIGGGIVCDIAGFAASTYMRGLKFGYVSTSLLSQVDASVGGKTGVNLKGYKNMVGLFSQPSFVICDIEMLETLPEDEYISGLGELVKYAVLSSDEMFKSIERKKEPILTRDKKTLQKMIFESVRFKAEVVQLDEKERGERRILNLGHTLGHAVEKIVGLKHGEAVSVGLAYAARISRSRKYLSEDDERRILSLLSSLGLPLDVKISGKKMFEAVLKDKKRDAGFIHFVFLHGIGNPSVERISLREMELMINDLC